MPACLAGGAKGPPRLRSSASESCGVRADASVFARSASDRRRYLEVSKSARSSRRTWAQALQILWAENVSTVANVALTARCREFDLESLNTLLGHCAKNGLHVKAKRLLAGGKLQTIEPSLLSHNLCLTSSLRSFQWTELLRGLEQMTRSWVRGDVVTENCLMAVLARSQGWQHCVRRLAQVHMQDMVTYTTAGSAMIQAGAWSLAVQVFGQASNSGCQPDAETYAVLCTSCLTPAKTGRSKSTWCLASRFLAASQLHAEVNIKSLGSTIAICGKASHWRRSARLLQECHVRSFQPGRLEHNSVPRSWRSGLQSLRDMCIAKLEPDGASWSGLLVSGSWRLCGEVLLAASVLGFQRDGVLVSTSLGALNAAPWRVAMFAMASTKRTDNILQSVVLRARAQLRCWQQGLSQLRTRPRPARDMRDSSWPIDPQDSAVLMSLQEGAAWAKSLQITRWLVSSRCKPGLGMSATLTACGPAHWQATLVAAGWLRASLRVGHALACARVAKIRLRVPAKVASTLVRAWARWPQPWRLSERERERETGLSWGATPFWLSQRGTGTFWFLNREIEKIT